LIPIWKDDVQCGPDGVMPSPFVSEGVESGLILRKATNEGSEFVLANNVTS
jgi:hypothetical protein